MLSLKMKILGLLLVSLALLTPSRGFNQREALKWLLESRRSSNGGQPNINTDEWLSSSHASSNSGSRLIPQQGSQKTDRIDALPGQPHGVDFQQFSGYVTVNSSAGRALFYYLAEAPEQPSTKPLLLWLNGGPGCSSLGYGAMTELGPFRVNPDSETLSRNPYAWNQVANTLFLESPAGVGFSYSNRSSDYSDITGDRTTAEDSYAFLVNWLERFPQYKSRSFYIAGESYAGHYIPQLAETIIRYNNQKQNTFINLKGILVGNGVMKEGTDDIGRIDYQWSHALISDQTYEGIHKYCDFSSTGRLSNHCNKLLNTSSSEIGQIDYYNIYAPLCIYDNSTSNNSTNRQANVENFDPCSDNYVIDYLNIPAVQRALHANVTNLPYLWYPCSEVILRWNDSPLSVVPVYEFLIKSGLQITIFSGDVDAVVSVTSTRYSINVLKLPIHTEWYPWVNGVNEVGGYSVIYKGLTFATVRGAGHEVPSYQPSRALTLVKYFLQGKPLPSQAVPNP